MVLYCVHLITNVLVVHYNHVRSCDALLGIPLDEPIQSIVSDGKRIFTAAANNVHVWKRGKKVRELNYYAVYSMNIFTRILIFKNIISN